MSIYIDTSALTPLFVAEAASVALLQWLPTEPQAIWLSDLAHVEFAVTMAVKRRMGFLDDELEAAVTERFEAWAAEIPAACEVAPADLAEAERFVRRKDMSLRAPDAIHIAAATRLEAKLLTLDLAMREAARTLGCAIASFEA